MLFICARLRGHDRDMCIKHFIMLPRAARVVQRAPILGMPDLDWFFRLGLDCLRHIKPRRKLEGSIWLGWLGSLCSLEASAGHWSSTCHLVCWVRVYMFDQLGPR